MREIWHSFIRASAFLRKEIVNVLRQPRLVLTLVLGPFIILLVYGIGFREEARPLRTLFVATPDNALRPYVEQYATSLGPQLVFAGISEGLPSALEKLHQGTVDTVVVVPGSAPETIQRGDQAAFSVYHNEILPTLASYVEYTMNMYLNELNRRVLTGAIQRQQEQAAAMQEDVKSSLDAVDKVNRSLSSTNTVQAEQDVRALVQSIQAISPTLETITNTVGGPASDPLTSGSVAELGTTAALLLALQQDASALQHLDLGVTGQETQTLSRTEQDLKQLNDVLSTVRNVSGAVIVSPFKAETLSITGVKIKMTDYYTPGVIALLLQHVCVTFAALSIVQEDQLGSLELFQIAPLTPTELLTGKFVSYVIFNGLLAAALSALIVYVLHVPMLGSWGFYALEILGLIFAALGIGFLISLVARSTSQAVQASMILLLSSVFFTGFLQDIESLKPWVRVISWSLPATYGTQLLQTTMLRGQEPPSLLLVGLLSIGILTLVVDLALLHRRLKQE